ncbi:haloacid dehalogenase superfamily enzyme, subfamily IA [Hoeflea sp. IMCC20628]|uniref:HAD family hydrolase n=1 Tax=Hoeflea sp. IMCC20628 TaxID=1620421 RepID=UPI00063BF3D8|nr:HAD family hydrolase [Hoeflea sp. IMCC20628]AKI00093.1 haloacid dehalogenase superfamily enzyme, subfamily IA [Hoeflea sp. IMCC20628]
MTWKMSKTIKAILFDKDGTLIDFDKTWAATNRKGALIAADGEPELADILLNECGTDPVTGKTRADSMFAAANASEIAAHMVIHGSPIEHGKLVRLLDQIFIDGAESPWPICDLNSLLDKLTGAGLTLGIASSDGEASIRRTVEVLGLSRHISFVAGYDSGYGPKPEPGMINAFAAHLGVSPAEIAMVGDNGHDMEMARAAGAGAAIGVLSGTGTRETLTQLADVLVGSVADLPALLADR